VTALPSGVPATVTPRPRHDQITVGADNFPPLDSYQVGEWTGPDGKDVGDSLFSYRQLVSLPTRPQALRARLQQAEKQLAWREARRARADATATQSGAFAELSQIASLLTSPLPGAERLALFVPLSRSLGPGSTVAPVTRWGVPALR
jgi:hypothetical protein